MRLQQLASAIALLVFGPFSVAAQDEGARDSNWTFELGAGAGIGPDYEGSDDYEFTALPIIDVSWKDRIRLTTKGGPGLIGTPYRDDSFSVDIGLFYDGGRDQDDNDALRGLGDLDVGAVAMARLGYAFGPLEAGLEMTRDLTGDRDGMTATAELEYGVALFDDQLHLGVTPYITWANGDYMDNTFGISASQSASSLRGLTQYNAGSGLKDAGLSVNLGYQITDNISAFGGAEYSRLLGNAADSPLVADEGSANQFGAFLGLSYRW
ncbi:MipA/OmpV family protein [Pelagibius sp. Alg239-R121]|uniref:MipA/OmpV family protein n=1 Tax=Pelagibius sp. Alg239-R121 TaxID=2993448 RepID=UPI0024A65439|nr:MipA/OmpV family protein [Pelagibius sp. Alg239-R121]